MSPLPLLAPNPVLHERKVRHLIQLVDSRKAVNDLRLLCGH